jgi:hypothetical protein
VKGSNENKLSGAMSLSLSLSVIVRQLNDIWQKSVKDDLEINVFQTLFSIQWMKDGRRIRVILLDFDFQLSTYGCEQLLFSSNHNDPIGTRF